MQGSISPALTRPCSPCLAPKLVSSNVRSDSCFYFHPQGRKPGYFSFLDPFSPGVWLFMLLAYLAVSCILFLVARYSLPIPFLTLPPRVHLWELPGKGGEEVKALGPN